MNKDYILNKIKPYLNKKGMLSESDFNRLFALLTRREQYEIVNILIESNIDIDYFDNSSNNKKKVVDNKFQSNSKQILDKLTNEQLCILYQRGNEQALGELVSKNKRLVWSRAKKYSGLYKHKLDEEDLYEYGMIGFIKAAERFESKRDTKFITYAVWWIDQSILRSIANYGFTIRIPIHYFDGINRLLRIFRDNPGYTKDQIWEIAYETGMERSEFEEMLGIIENTISLASLNTFVGDDENSELCEFVTDENAPTVEELIEENELKEIVNDILDTITPREEKILRLRFGIDDDIPRTLEEIGKEFKVTRERIRQIEVKALRKLRHPSRSNKLKDFV